MLKRIIGLLFFIVIFTSCGRVAQPATIVDTPVKSYSPNEKGLNYFRLITDVMIEF